jgi:hypothetical protein
MATSLPPEAQDDFVLDRRIAVCLRCVSGLRLRTHRGGRANLINTSTYLLIRSPRNPYFTLIWLATIFFGLKSSPDRSR